MDALCGGSGGGTTGDNDSETVGQIYCGGYVFYMSDHSRFRRQDVEPVSMSIIGDTRQQSSLSICPSANKKRKRRSETDDDDDNAMSFHICDEAGGRSTSDFHLGDKCASWTSLTPDQREALSQLSARVKSDRTENVRFTCAILEGPGGCGKTRLMAHVMNHSRVNAIVLYVTKQNKRVQDFIHTDCLSGETDPTVRKPIDLTSKSANEIYDVLKRPSSVGRYAVTAEKLAFAIGRLSPRVFSTTVTVSALGILTKGLIKYGNPPNRTEVTVTDGNESSSTNNAGEREVIVVMDEYTMLQPPLIHAIVHHLRLVSESPVVLLMGGDQYQCGPVGWNDRSGGGGGSTESASMDKRYYTGDVRHEIVSKIGYEPLELNMVNMKRCRGDAALGVCVRRLRRVCGERPSYATRNMVNRALAAYSLESKVAIFRKTIDPNGLFSIVKVMPADAESLVDAVDGSTDDFDRRVSLVDEEDMDTRSVRFVVSPVEPTRPMYDLLPLVRHYTDLFVRLAETAFARPDRPEESWPDVVLESVERVRRLFPVVMVLTNSLCNVFAESFLLALSTKVRECVLTRPLPSRLVGRIASETWTAHLRSTLRRCIRSLTIDEHDAFRRQTLFLGMVYKMTSTMKAIDSCGDGLCNGETVVLTSIVFAGDDVDALDSIKGVTLRKLDRNTEEDLLLRAGLNENRMTGAQKMGVMPFVPYVSENIYQMQGNTIGPEARTFVDVADVPCQSAYVAISRFQESASIKGIVIAAAD